MDLRVGASPRAGTRSGPRDLARTMTQETKAELPRSTGPTTRLRRTPAQRWDPGRGPGDQTPKSRLLPTNSILSTKRKMEQNMCDKAQWPLPQKMPETMMHWNYHRLSMADNPATNLVTVSPLAKELSPIPISLPRSTQCRAEETTTTPALCQMKTLLQTRTYIKSDQIRIFITRPPLE